MLIKIRIAYFSYELIYDIMNYSYKYCGAGKNANPWLSIAQTGLALFT